MIYLRHLFAKLSRRANPDANFARTLKQQVIGPQASRTLRIKTWISRMASVLLITVPLAGVSTAAYAYSSPDVLPQHPLYGVRLALESVEERLTPADQKEAVQA